jgi:hypothetical protein
MGMQITAKSHKVIFCYLLFVTYLVTVTFVFNINRCYILYFKTFFQYQLTIFSFRFINIFIPQKKFLFKIRNTYKAWFDNVTLS